MKTCCCCCGDSSAAPRWPEQQHRQRTGQSGGRRPRSSSSSCCFAVTGEENDFNGEDRWLKDEVLTTPIGPGPLQWPTTFANSCLILQKYNVYQIALRQWSEGGGQVWRRWRQWPMRSDGPADLLYKYEVMTIADKLGECSWGGGVSRHSGHAVQVGLHSRGHWRSPVGRGRFHGGVAGARPVPDQGQQGIRPGR